MKKIKPGEQFQLGNKIFTYSLQDNKITLTPIKEGKPIKKDNPPPSLKEVEEFFSKNGYSKELAKRFFDYYENGEPPWTDRDGKKVKAWKRKAISVWFKEENKEKKEVKEEPQTGFMF